MTIKKALQTTKVLGGSRHDVGGAEFAFLDFSQPELGAAPHSIAVPVAEIHKLAQIAMQAMPLEQKHALIASLVSLLNEPIPEASDGLLTRVFGVDDWGAGNGHDGSVILTIGFGASGGSLSFRFERRGALELALALKTLARGGVPASNTAIPKHPFLSVAEDIEWLRDEWVACNLPPSTAELRRASGTLRHLLIDAEPFPRLQLRFGVSSTFQYGQLVPV